MLGILTSSAATPVVLWRPAMRTAVTEVLAPHLEPGTVPEASVEALAAFEHDALAGELVVHNVYVRLLVEVRPPPERRKCKACFV